MACDGGLSSVKWAVGYGVSSGTRPLSDPEVIEEEAEVTLEKREPTPLAAQH